MNAKIIYLSSKLPVFVVKEDLNYGISPYEVKVMFVLKNDLHEIRDHFKTKQMRNDFFNKIDEKYIEKEIEEFEI